MTCAPGSGTNLLDDSVKGKVIYAVMQSIMTSPILAELVKGLCFLIDRTKLLSDSK